MRQTYDNSTSLGKSFSKTGNFNSLSSKNIHATQKNPLSNPSQEYFSSYNIRLFGGRRESEGKMNLSTTAYKTPTVNHLGVKYYKNDSGVGTRYNYTSGLNSAKYSNSGKIDLYSRLNNRILSGSGSRK